MRLRIVTYNILHGFHQTQAPFSLESERQEAAKRTIKSLDPDILVLTEACYGGKNRFGMYQDYKNIFGYEYGFFAGYNSHWGNMILSKTPIDATKEEVSHRSAIRAYLLDKKRHPMMCIDVFHPHPQIVDAEKAEILRPLLDTRPQHIAYMLTGDLNTLSDEDTYDKDRLVQGFRTFAGELAEEKVNRLLQRGLVPALRSYGLKDAFSLDTRQATIPTTAFGDERSSVRLDYFFINEHIAPQMTAVVKNEDTHMASDHYPIIMDFEI